MFNFQARIIHSSQQHSKEVQGLGWKQKLPEADRMIYSIKFFSDDGNDCISIDYGNEKAWQSGLKHFGITEIKDLSKREF